jgi:valyl-tRNA synthetase
MSRTTEAEAQAKKHGKDAELKQDEDVLDTWFSSASVAVLDAWAGRGMTIRR